MSDEELKAMFNDPAAEIGFPAGLKANVEKATAEYFTRLSNRLYMLAQISSGSMIVALKSEVCSAAGMYGEHDEIELLIANIINLMANECDGLTASDIIDDISGMVERLQAKSEGES